jgi:hypothetical protein
MASVRAKTKTKTPAKPAARPAAKKPAPKVAVKAPAKTVAKVAPKPVAKPVPKPQPQARPIIKGTDPRIPEKSVPRIPPPPPRLVTIKEPALPVKVSAQPEPFRLVSIERTEPPNGAAGKNWYRYTIRQGVNAINGYLQGTQTAVKTSAEQIVGQLNERRAGRWGYRTTRTAAPAAAT